MRPGQWSTRKKDFLAIFKGEGVKVGRPSLSPHIPNLRERLARFRVHPMIVRRSLQIPISILVLFQLSFAFSLPSSEPLRFALVSQPQEGMRLRGGGLPFPSKSAVAAPPSKSVMETKTTSFPALVQQLAIVIAMALITVFSRPSTLTPVGGSPSIQHVFHYGWVAALSTGLGALPLLFMGKVP